MMALDDELSRHVTLVLYVQILGRGILVSKEKGSALNGPLSDRAALALAAQLSMHVALVLLARRFRVYAVLVLEE